MHSKEEGIAGIGITFLFCIFAAIQIAIPMHYYLSRRYTVQKFDERFAWRMFSTTRMARCIDSESQEIQPTFFVDGAKINLTGRFHEAWIALAKRGRLSVTEEMAKHLSSQGRKVQVRYRCDALNHWAWSNE